MISIFATCKDRDGDFRRLNSLSSFKQLTDDVIVFEDDGLEVERNEFGTPFLKSLFAEGERLAKYEIVAYSNADIILFPDFVEAAELLDKLMPRFLMVGRRTNWQRPRPISLDDLDRNRVQFVQEVKTNSRLFNPATDYLVFRRGTFDYGEWPNFAMGKFWWDPWTVWHALQKGIPVVDVTQAVLAVHQNHPPTHRSWDVEGLRNLALARESEEAGIDLDDATHILTGDLRLEENKR